MNPVAVGSGDRPEHLQAPGAAGPPPPSPPQDQQQQLPQPQPPHWDAVLQFILPHLHNQGDRSTARLVCREWRAAADGCWRAGALNCGLRGRAVAAAPLNAASLRALLLSSPPAPPFVPRLRELCLTEVGNDAQLAALLRQLAQQPRALPCLHALSLSAALGAQLHDGGALAGLDLPLLQRLELQDVVLQHPSGLGSSTHLASLTELCVGLTAPPAHPASAFIRSVHGVAHLAALRRLQALSLPQLAEEEREALSALTALTRLAFTAAGKGAVGPSLQPLVHLQALDISLFHVLEHFIVLHPRLDWAALRTLRTLRTLSVRHLAANTFFVAPEVTWSDEAPAAHEADLLLAALPDVQEVQLRLSYCRLPEEHATSEGEPHHLATPSGRTFHRTIERVPVRKPGRRRTDAWHDAWWQPAVLAQIEASAAGARGPVVAAFAAEALALRLMDTAEVAGWAAIRPGSYLTHDVLVTITAAELS